MPSQFLVASKVGGNWSSELVESIEDGFSVREQRLRVDGDDNPSLTYGMDPPEGASDLRFASVSAGCSLDADCDDGNECTTDTCVAGDCENVAVLDDTECNGGAGVCCGGACTTPCASNLDCDDGEDCTDDQCLGMPGSCSAYCNNGPAPDDTYCDGGNGVCCSGACTTPCLSGGDCDDGDLCTDDFCQGTPGTCSAYCDNVFDPTNDPSCDACVPTHNNEKGPRCSDGLDNDCDGWIDGDDPDCK